MKNDPDHFIFTEDIDYSQTLNTSIWGIEDKLTQDTLHELAQSGKLHGDWLSIAAGDGRYTDTLLSHATSVTATDIDPAALEKLKKITDPDLREKLHIQAQDITKPFPFISSQFDGVFNTGTLHLFPEQVLDGIIKETSRILKHNGMCIFDFATDISRIKSDGARVGTKNLYRTEQAKKMLEYILHQYNFTTRFLYDSVSPESVTSGDGTYMFSCNYWLVIAAKNT